MSLTYGFFDSYEGDRTYEAADFNRLFDGIITDGVFEDVGEAFSVTSAENGMMLIIGTGRAWFNNTWTYNDSVYPLLIPDSESVLNRIDAVVLEIDKTNEGRQCDLKIVTGTPAYEDPEKPTLVKADGIYQYALAYITVDANQVEITENEIEQVIGNDETPYVTGEINYLSIENVLLEWNSAFDEYFEAWKVNKQADFSEFMSKIVNELTTTQIGQIQTTISEKENAPTRLEQTLIAGSTSMSFTNSNIKDTSLIEVYGDPYGAILLNATQVGHTINLTFTARNSNTSILVLVRNN